MEDNLFKKYTFQRFILDNKPEMVIEKNGLALKYASKEFKNDRKMVLLAVKSNGNALKYASEELQKDPEIINIAKNNLNNKMLFK
tara:strand:+ start:609 stop:863 length:255 start_codon:yes stop_codon:yes gene_type:complete